MNDEIAKRIVARMPPEVGFDPVTILFILSSLISIFVNCWRLTNPTSDELHAELVHQHNKHPDRLRRRLASRILIDSPQPVSREQAYALADATIAEAISSPTAFASVLSSTPVEQMHFSADE